MQIGGLLRSGKPHDGRAPDYDDWNLNCDIFFWDETLNRALEVSSMGIRVDAESLDRQLTLAHCDDRRTLPFHKMLLNNDAAPDHRRRYRPEPSVHADDGLRPHRRSTVQRMGQRNCGRLRKGRDPAAVIYILTKDAADTTASFSYKQISKIG